MAKRGDRPERGEKSQLLKNDKIEREFDQTTRKFGTRLKGSDRERSRELGDTENLPQKVRLGKEQ